MKHVYKTAIPCDFETGATGDGGVFRGGDEATVDGGRRLSPVLSARATHRALHTGISGTFIDACS